MCRCVCGHTGTWVAIALDGECKRLPAAKACGIRHGDSELLLHKAAPSSAGRAGRAPLWEFSSFSVLSQIFTPGKPLS